MLPLGDYWRIFGFFALLFPDPEMMVATFYGMFLVAATFAIVIFLLLAITSEAMSLCSGLVSLPIPYHCCSLVSGTGNCGNNFHAYYRRNRVL
ncbi:MAG: hypothetical protein MZV70_13990 [Desulfobacterales bacterium]|nr:hypothetical protein [Desulfobacterales bacterium]